MSYWCPLSTCFRVRALGGELIAVLLVPAQCNCFRVRGLGGELIVSYWCLLSACFRVRGFGGELVASYWCPAQHLFQG